MSKNNKKTIIIGGGASGIVASIFASQRGEEVIILERMDKIGKKILATGNGKCNLTNMCYNKNSYRGDDKEFAYKVLSDFSHFDTINFFNKLGVYLKDKNGYIYPYSEQANTILDALIYKLNSLNIKVITNCEVKEIIKNKNMFLLKTTLGEFKAEKVVISTGGKSQEKLGSNGSGYKLAKNLGHSIVKPLPALTGLKSNLKCFKNLAGVRANVRITLIIDGKEIVKEDGELQFTDYGISGVVVFQISRFAIKSLSQNKKVKVIVDFMRDLSLKEVKDLLYNAKKDCPYKNIQELLSGFFNKKLISIFAKETKNINEIAKNIKQFEIPIIGYNDFDKSQVTQGGVSTKEINPDTMESKIVNNLYFTGEVLDIDGACGGYNLQFAWATASKI